MTLLRSLLAVVSVVLSFGFSAAYPFTTELCFITYSLAGDIDYPWSVAVSLYLTYNIGQETNQHGTYQPCYDAHGTYSYTNKFGHSTTHEVSSEGAEADFYIGSQYPVDPTGIILNFVDVADVQLPGVGPETRFGTINIQAGPGFVELTGTDPYGDLDNTFRIDPLGQAWLSPYTGFVNHTIGGGNINSGAVVYKACQAPINFVNGVRRPLTPTLYPWDGANYAHSFTYSYTIGDGSTWSTTTTISITASDVSTDELGNQYQTISAVSGSRVYTYLPTGLQNISTITGLSTSVGTPSQRWYPFALLQSSPGIYSTNTAPFIDGDGIGIHINPAAPVNGDDPSVSSVSVTDITVSFTLVDSNDPSSVVVLTESNTDTSLSSSVQSQTYTLTG